EKSNPYSRWKGESMEFGIFSHMHVPHDDTEHARFQRELEVSEAADAAGFKYDWAPEHHFLERYSHQPAHEVYLSWVAARTKRIHVGHSIVNITAPVNHPVRVAERIATMDHLSEGRVEFGTGRGSSSAEWSGFAIPSAAETKPMWQEAIEHIPRMWREEYYAYEGKYFRGPHRAVPRVPSTSGSIRSPGRRSSRRRGPCGSTSRRRTTWWRGSGAAAAWSALPRRSPR